MKIIDKFKANAFLKSVLSVGFGNLVGQLLAVVTVPLLSRIYSVESYGEYGIIVSTATIIISFATLGLMSAIMVPKDDQESNEIFTAAFWTQFWLSTVFVIIAISIMKIYKFHTVRSSYVLSLIIMWFYIILTNLKNILYVSINRKGMNKVLLLNPIIGAVGNLIIALPLGLIKFGYEGFFIAAIISESIMCVQMMIKYNPMIWPFGAKKYFKIIKKYREYVLFQSPSNLLETFSSQYPVQYFSRVFDNVVLGAYTMCVKLMQYPVMLLAQPISTVYFRTATEYRRDGKNFADFTFKMITRILLVAFLPTVIVIFWGKPLFTFVLGEKWGEAGTLSSILIYQYVLYFCSKCISYCRVVLGRQKINFVFNIVNLAVSMISCVVGYVVFHNLIGTVAIFSASKCLLQIADITLDFKCMKQNTLKFVMFIAVYSVLIIVMLIFKLS